MSQQQEKQLKQANFDTLSNEDKIKRGLDITHALIKGTLQDVGQLQIPDDLQSFTLLSFDVSPFPTLSRKVMKYIPTDILQRFVQSSDCFVQVDKTFSVVFTSLEDLTYHNFENILNLDHLFDQVEFNLSSKKKKFSNNVSVFSIEGSTDTLLSLDKLNYYTVPLNSSQRGGKRLIFHSNQLSDALTRMVQESSFFNKKNFIRVNNVFRLNNFAPGDKKFKSHYDTPFADRSKNLYSKYTMLIYLTGSGEINKSEPPLKFGDLVIKSIEQNDCIIFDQQLEHEGHSYVDNNKIFIRTELIFHVKNFEYDEKVARMFNSACYMTKEIDQQQYAADLFNACVKMRYRIEENLNIPRVYYMKRNLQVTYVTDGNYFWFQKDMPLKSAALLVVIDYFNGKLQYELKNIRIRSKQLPRRDVGKEEESDESIFDSILQASFQEDKQLQNDDLKKYIELDNLISEDLCEDYCVFQCSCGIGGGGTQTAQELFTEKKKETVQKLKKILNDNSVIIFDNLIKINYLNIQVKQDKPETQDKEQQRISGKISLSDFYTQTSKKINFASCQCECEYNDEDVVLFKKEKLFTFCLPEISYEILPNGVKLSIDIFNNGFVYASKESFKLPYTDRELTESMQEQRRNRRRQQNGDDEEEDDDEDDEDNDEDDEEKENEKDSEKDEDEDNEEDEDEENEEDDSN